MQGATKCAVKGAHFVAGDKLCRGDKMCRNKRDAMHWPTGIWFALDDDCGMYVSLDPILQFMRKSGNFYMES